MIYTIWKGEHYKFGIQKMFKLSQMNSIIVIFFQYLQRFLMKNKLKQMNILLEL